MSELRRFTLAVMIALLPATDAPASAVHHACSILLAYLSNKTVRAHIERGLFSKYHVSKSGSGGLLKLNGHWYSVRQFPVKMDRTEEWTPAIGGSLFLLTRKRSEAVIKACRAVLQEQPTAIPLLRRVVVQARLWDVFDSLFRDGVTPMNYGHFNIRRWRRELADLATVMRFLSVKAASLEPYRSGATDIPALVGAAEVPHWTEFYDRRSQ